MQNYLFAAAFQRHAVVCNVDGVLADQSAAEHKAVQHIHILHHAVPGQQIDHRVEGRAQFSDAHIHILIIDAKDGVGAVLFQPDAVIRVPCGGLRRAAEGDGALGSFQLHRSAAVSIGQHRGVGGGQRDLHIQLPPAPPGGGAAPAPEHQPVLLRQQQAQVIQLVVFQRVHPHACQIAAAAQALVVAALRHIPVKGLHGLAQHLLLHGIRVQPHALKHFSHGDLLSGGKIEAPAPGIPRIGTAVVAEHHKADAVAVPVGIPVDISIISIRAPLVLLGLDLRAVLVLSEFCRIHGGKLIVDISGVRAVAHKLRHMDVQLLCAAPLVQLDGLFQRELLGDAVFLCCLHRRVCGALGDSAGACGGSGSRCAAAPRQHHRRRQHRSGKAFVFHGGSPCFLNRSCGSSAAGSRPRQRGFARRSWSWSGSRCTGPS